MKPLISHGIFPQTLYLDKWVNEFPFVKIENLLSTSENGLKYGSFFKKKLMEEEFSILSYDEGCFETDTLTGILKEFYPSHLILPNCLNNYDNTVEKALSFLEQSEEVFELLQKATLREIKFIGVLQGANMQQIINCIKFYKWLKVDNIALPSHILPYNEVNISLHLKPGKKVVVDEKMFYTKIRASIFKQLLEQGQLDGMNIHFLGCENFQEFSHYSPTEIENIKSIYTSLPITSGINMVNFDYKENCELKFEFTNPLELEVKTTQIACMMENVKTFRKVFGKEV